MDSIRRDPRKMSDEEVVRWMQELIDRSANENGCAGTVGACSMGLLKTRSGEIS